MIPQAYTARDIGEAYKWIQTLPPHMKEELKTMEQMVLSYLKSKSMGTLGNYASEGPKKSQEFQKTLQNLKAEMDQFDFVRSDEPTPPVAVPQSAAPAQPQPNAVPQISQIAQQAPLQPNLLAALKLDPRSRQIVNDIKDGFNLSSDLEVIRMSLVLAHKTLKNLIE